MKFKFDDIPPPGKNQKRRGEQQMSVKQMTSDQIQDDLESIKSTWPGGVPPEQTDRVNALKSELKRRGEEVRTSRPKANGTKPTSIKAMTDEQLEAELRKLSNAIGADPKDEELQTRFADVRYEMRQRNNRTEPSSPSVTPRSIEIPDEESMPAKNTGSITVTLKAVRGLAAEAGGRGVILKYTKQADEASITQVALSLTIEEAKTHIENVRAAIAMSNPELS